MHLGAWGPGNMKLMIRFVRIAVVMICASGLASAVHDALDIGQEFLGPGFLNELVDLALLLGAMLLTSLSDRELFGWTGPKQERPGHRSNVA
jgi:hypothetical protein